MVNNCQLYIQHDLASNALGFITITYDPETDLTVRVSQSIDEPMIIETDEISLSYVADNLQDGIFFNLTDKQSGESKMLGFDLRYWKSF